MEINYIMMVLHYFVGVMT